MLGDDPDQGLRRKLTRRPVPPRETPGETGPAATLLRSFSRVLSATTPLVAEDAALHRKGASLAELLDTVEPDAFVVTLAHESRVGLALIDQAGFATLIEAMTIGRLTPRLPAARRATPTDAALLAGLIDSALGDLAPDDPAQAWRCERPVPDHRLLPVLLDEGGYDLVALTTQLVAGPVARGARLLLAFPTAAPDDDRAHAEPPAAARPSWAEAMENAVLSAPANLRAELGRIRLPLGEVLELGVGSALTMALSNLEEVRLVALDGTVHGVGRLGQTRGNRAVRLTQLPGQAPGPLVMQDAIPLTAPAPPPIEGAP